MKIIRSDKNIMVKVIGNGYIIGYYNKTVSPGIYNQVYAESIEEMLVYVENYARDIREEEIKAGGS